MDHPSKSHTVRESCDLTFRELGLDPPRLCSLDERFYHSKEMRALIVDATKARTLRGWKPTHTFAKQVSKMVQSDFKIALGQPEVVYED